ncbi:MAG: transcriptional repressor LexA [Puniceicoccaceae bacterium]
MEKLTFKQAEVLKYLRLSASRDGFWPSIRDIQEYFNFKSTNSVIGHLRALERKGYVRRKPGQARAFSLLEDEGEVPLAALRVTSIPILGSIAAGYPDRVEGGGEVGQLQVDVQTARSRRHDVPVFAIRVSGDSMIMAGIDDGDTVVIEGREPRDGEIVAALIDGEVTLKRFVKNQGGSPYLKAENPAYPELFPIEELRIQGVARAVVKSL